MKRKNRLLEMTSMVVLIAVVATAVAAETYVSKTVQVQNWYIGPQPSVADLDEMKAKGVGLVINTRRPVEMEQLDFDQPPEVYARGMRYLNIPVGGEEYPFEPSMLETFTRAVDSSSGPILMHCRSGYRVSVLAAAYLVTEQGVPLELAIETVGNQRVNAETVKQLLAN